MSEPDPQTVSLSPLASPKARVVSWRYIKQGWLQQRFVLAIMLFFGVMNLYTMRVCLSVAIVRMASKPVPHELVEDPDRCPDPETGLVTPAANSTGASSPHVTDFTWTAASQGVLLSSFYYGYVVSHVPGGMISDRFGGKHTLGLGLLGTALTTLLSPEAAYAGFGYLVALRIIMGLGEGVTFPAISALLSQWVPPNERSRVGSFVYAGAQLGTVVGTALSGQLLHYFHWSVTFYFFGSMGLVWYFLWSFLCYSSPSNHPFITTSEREFLQNTIKSRMHGQVARPTPWKGILTSWPVWGLVVIQVGHDWGFFTMITDLPKYMESILRYNIAENGLLSSLPYLVMLILSQVFGSLADWLIVHKKISIVFARKLFTSIASLTTAFGILAASYAGCNGPVVVTLLTLGLGGMGGAYCGMRVNALDLTKNHAGAVMALVNGVGAISGLVSPMLIGLMTPNETLAEWRRVFWVVFGVLIATNTVYVVTAKGTVQDWDRLEEPYCEEVEGEGCRGGQVDTKVGVDTRN